MGWTQGAARVAAGAVRRGQAMSSGSRTVGSAEAPPRAGEHARGRGRVQPVMARGQWSTGEGVVLAAVGYGNERKMR